MEKPTGSFEIQSSGHPDQRPNPSAADLPPFPQPSATAEPGSGAVATTANTPAAVVSTAPTTTPTDDLPVPSPKSSAVPFATVVAFVAEATTTFNLAMQQNFVPVLGFVRVTNTGNEPLNELTLSITADPGFFEPFEQPIAALAPGGTFELKEPPLKVSADFLLGLKERISARLGLKLTCGDQTLSVEKPLHLLAFNECDGFLHLPELISTSILPNSPAVEKLLAKSADCLRAWGEPATISGYQSKDPGVVRKIAAAIFAAIAACRLTYCVPPASFEKGGQKVRFPEMILENGLATCFDLSLLCCACLEQAGLHPLIIFTPTHAFVGVWLKNESFPVCFVDSALPLRKRVELREILVFETTILTGAAPNFETAVTIAEQKLSADDIIGFTDIKRCRSAHILPLPITFDGALCRLAPRTAVFSEAISAPKPHELAQLHEVSLEPGSRPAESRIDQWKRKLLDLSLRNKLLNFRETGKTIKITCSSLAKLEDGLADGQEYRVKPLPPNLEAGRSTQAHLETTGTEIIAEFTQREFEQHRLYSPCSEAALEKNLLETFREARNSLEEGGTNTLYLALGFLYWTESTSSDQQRAAPIVLVPLEIRRSSVKDGFTMVRRDEEPQINVTLLEMLKLDFNLDIPGLDPLPLDEHGIDLEKTLTTMRRAILERTGWEVRDEAAISNFQFRKFLMFKDLELRSAKLLENKVVNHLVISPESRFPSQGEFPDAAHLDAQFALDQTYCPLSADSSQTAAVFAAAAGRSFVLHGPPGTGKSQTITNIIAHAVASGKTVLFVSEKAAALNVVYNRLSRIGLGPYSLELHSNKSRKAEVLEQLKKALAPRAPGDTRPRRDTVADLQTVRNELNDYVTTLHQPHPNGESFFQALSTVIGLNKVPETNLPWAGFSGFQAADLQQVKTCLDKVALLSRDCRPVAANPWKDTRAAAWSPELNRSLTEWLNLVADAGKTLPGRCADLAGLLGFDGWANSLNGLAGMISLMTALLEAPPGATRLLETDAWDLTQRSLHQITAAGRTRDEARSRLLERGNPGILNLNPAEITANWENALASYWPLSWLRKRAVLSVLNQQAKNPAVFGEDDVRPLVEALSVWQTQAAELKAADEPSFRSFGSAWNEGEADWNHLDQLITWAGDLHRTAGSLAAETGVAAAVVKARLVALYERLQAAGPESEIRTLGRQWVDHARRLVEGFGKLRQTLELVVLPTDPREAPLAFVTALQRAVGAWQAALPDFRNWCRLNAALKEAETLGLAALVNDLRAGAISDTLLWPVFQKSYLSAWTEHQATATPLLRDFSGTLHNDRLERFRRLDETFLELTAKAVVAKVAERIPASSEAVAATSELGILQREIQKKTRHKPLRVLFAEIAHVLPRIKPCFLMSPISVAQYLAPDHPPFDLVIFDEASQVPVWDAIGAIARGKDLIVVGDPKQLPPTSFFSRAESQEWEESDLTEDLESILDDCIAAGLPDMHLNWHYRSLHESLIAFSNRCYYENRLFTFPPACFTGLGIQSHFLARAPYDKGKTRTNPEEAKAVTAEIVKRLRDPRTAKFSLGVVTFSTAQQTLIEDLLDDARRQDPRLEEFFGEACPEPVFIKNLESVQGDERDVILFSICYGPDADGKVSMNFGPLNQTGGERRLNVAVTRARRELVVFTALKSDMISLSRTRAVGVKHLKMFLDFAERGIPALVMDAGVPAMSPAVSPAVSPTALSTASSVALPGAASTSPVSIVPAAGGIETTTGGSTAQGFEQSVGEALRAAGYDIHSRVGCSGYRIDLAIVHPDFPGRYLLGIECDGDTYKHAATARDRDKLRHAVLQQLGWHLHRIWISDWRHNPAGELEKIRQRVSQCLQLVADATNNETLTPATDEIAIPCHTNNNGTPEHDETAPEADTQKLDHLPEPAADQPGAAVSFRFWPGNAVILPAAAFDQARSQEALGNMIEAVTACEGPVSLPQLSRRICAQYGISRVTQRIMTRLQQIAATTSVYIDTRHAQVFFWSSPDAITAFTTYRRHTLDTRRKPEDLCPDEVANAAFAVLQANISMSEEDLFKHTAQCFGYRLGQNVTGAMQAGLAHLRQTRPLQLSDGKISLV